MLYCNMFLLAFIIFVRFKKNILDIRISRECLAHTNVPSARNALLVTAYIIVAHAHMLKTW